MNVREILASAVGEQACYSLAASIDMHMDSERPLDGRRAAYRGWLEVKVYPGRQTHVLHIPMRMAVAKLSSLYSPYCIAILQAMEGAGVSIHEPYEQTIEGRERGFGSLIHDAARHGSPAFLSEVIRLGGDFTARATCGDQQTDLVDPWLTPLEFALERTDTDAAVVVDIIQSALARHTIDQVLADVLATASPAAGVPPTP